MDSWGLSSQLQCSAVQCSAVLFNQRVCVGIFKFGWTSSSPALLSAATSVTSEEHGWTPLFHSSVAKLLYINI
jgi:hypothetical protein